MNRPQQNIPFGQSTQPGLLAKLIAFVLSAGFLVLAFMFSLVALAVVAVLGVVLGGWLRWKTRTMRKQMQQMAAAGQFRRETAADNGDQVIEGEFIRETGPVQSSPEQRLR